MHQNVKKSSGYKAPQNKGKYVKKLALASAKATDKRPVTTNKKTPRNGCGKTDDHDPFTNGTGRDSND